MRKLKRIKPLTAQEELDLINAWQTRKDPKALEHLYHQFAPLMLQEVKFRGGYVTVDSEDLFSETTFGFMKAADKFDPSFGCRFGTYLRWQLKAVLNNYVANFYSTMGARQGTSKRKSLFFKLRSAKEKMGIKELHRNTPQMRKVCEMFSCTENDVIIVQDSHRYNVSLNTPVHVDNEGRMELGDFIEDKSQSVDDFFEEEMRRVKLEAINEAIEFALNDRERHIFKTRVMTDKDITLSELGVKFNVSRERIRQVEARAIEKVRKYCEFVG